MVQGRATTTKMKRGAVAKRRTARFELKMVSHYYTLRMYVTTVFWNNGQTQMLTLNRNSKWRGVIEKSHSVIATMTVST